MADRVGAVASFLCAIHCALLPFMIAALPFLGMEFLADHRFERGFVMFACVLALLVLVRGFRRHRWSLPLLLAAPGLGLLLLGHRKGASWSGSQLSIEEARRLVPHHPATSQPVPVAV